MLGKEFLTIFNEVFKFQPISLQQRILIMNKMMSGWKQKPTSEAIEHALSYTNALQEVSKYLRQRRVHVG